MVFSNKYLLLSERKKKLIEEEIKLIHQRKKEIGALAEKYNLLIEPDEFMIGLFKYAQKAVLDNADIVGEWTGMGQMILNSKRGKAQKPTNEESQSPIKTPLLDARQNPKSKGVSVQVG